MKNHVIYFDIDGTLFSNKQQCVPKSVQEAIDLLSGEKYQLCLATGRKFQEIEKMVRQLYLWDEYICDNGHDVFNKDKELVYEKYFDPKVIERIVSIADKTDTAVELKTLEENFLVTQPNAAVEETYKFFGMCVPSVKKETTYSDIVSAMIFRDKNLSYDDYSKISEIEVHPGISAYADITIKGYNKGKAMKESLKRLDREKCIVIGDSLNDYNMLKEASVSIAMGNAEEKLKQIADYVTADIDNDGILCAAKWIIEQKFD